MTSTETNLTIQLTSIDDTDRAREDYGDLTGIKDSLTTLGTIHPIIVRRNPDGSFDLIAGGRRLRSARELGWKSATHSAVLEPGILGFLFKDEVSDETLKEAELHENLWRLKTKWQEDVVLVYDVHTMKVARHGSSEWGQKETAELLGKGYKKSKVSLSLEMAERLRAGDEQLRKAETMSEAIAIVVKRKEDEGLAELYRRTQGSSNVSTASFLDQINISLGDKPKPKTLSAAAKAVLGVGDTKVVPFVQSEKDEPTIIPLSSMFRCVDFRELCTQLPDACFDHIVTDIPYGIDMDNLEGIKNIDEMIATHGVEQNVDLMQPFLRESFRLVKSGGFCVFFYDLDHHEKLQTWAKDVGWKVQRWPLIAYKTSSCRNNAAQYNFTKNYEVAMVLRRDEQTVLRKPQTTSVWTGDFSAERKLYNNPFAKPFDLWKWIYDAIAFPGQSVFDPYVGEGSSVRAAVNVGLQPRGCEINEGRFLRCLETMKAVYALVYQSNVSFT